MAFGKKRKEEERKALEAQRQAQIAAQKKKAPTASWQKLSVRGPVPIARPADYIQLTPIVQPIPLVPYSTQLQPLAMYEDDFDDVEY